MNSHKSFAIEPGRIPDLAFLRDEPLMVLHSNSAGGRSFLACGIKRSAKAFSTAAGIGSLHLFLSEAPTWYFGVLAYEFGNRLVLPPGAGKPAIPGLPQYYFFEPRNLISWQNDSAEVILGEPGFAHRIEDAFNRPLSDFMGYKPLSGLRAAVSRDEYIGDVQDLMKAIQRGDIYEANYCYALEGKGELDPWRAWLKLNALTEAPFAGYMQVENHALLCGSPERFLCRDGNTLRSQPIKGTRKRGSSAAEDEALRTELLNDAKERSENIMITDLVRNDLSRLALPGSVQVEELCAVKSYKTVHQMVSTISAKLPERTNFSDILECAYPMGSMTGAPKASAMQLIARKERSPRGWYSGSIGWIDPNGDFDFNVVIRSLMYHRLTHEIRGGVGSAITAACNPEKEWEECALKASALVQSLGA